MLVLGARGSIPVSGPDFVRYGGNTSSFAIIVDDLAVAFVDAGTGLASYRSYGVRLAPRVSIFITHYHWDHIQGLSMLDELWRGACDITVHGPGDPSVTLPEAIRPPYFPVSISDATAISCSAMDGPVDVAGLTFSSFPLHHPQGAMGYRIDGPRRSIAFVADHEAGTEIDDEIRTAVEGVDVLIHDAQYLPSEQDLHVGWGHSTYEDAIRMAREIGATELILTSHDPRRTDREIDITMSHVRDEFEAALAAGQGLEVIL
jgi:ribonuclease BN (tRNA processing enzyme)